jgi:hypothetical protein
MPLCSWVDGNPRETCDPQIRKWVLHLISPFRLGSHQVPTSQLRQLPPLWIWKLPVGLVKTMIGCCVYNQLESSISIPDAAAVWPSEWRPSSPSHFF